MGEMLRQFIAGLQEHDARPIIRKAARVLAGFFLILIAMALYAPALGDTRFVFGTDTVSHDYIMHYYGWVQSISEAGELPLWNPYLFSGFPMIASAALCPFYPSQWLYFILPFNTAFTMQYILALAIGGIGAAWWMRCLGHRRSICVWAGLAYMVSGHFLTLTYAGHLQKMIALGWTPVALGATMQLVRYGRMGRRSTHLYKTSAVLGIALGMQLLASHPQIFYATAAACILQLIGMTLTALPWKSITPTAKPTEAAPTGRIILPVGEAFAMSALAVVVCVLVSAVQLLPTLEMSAISNRADGVSFVEAVETSYPPLEIFEYAVPQIFGDSVRNSAMPYFGKWGERIVSDYVGLPILFLALTGLFGSRRRYRWFLLILFITGIVIGFGRYTPVYWLLYHVMPGFDGFRSPGTFMFLSNCALIGLSAFGLDYLVSLANTVNNQGWGSSFSAPDEEHDTPRRSAFATTTADDTQPFAVDAIPQKPESDDTPPYMPSLEHEEAAIEDPGYVYSYGQAAGVSSSNFTWDNENTPWLGRPAMLVFLAAVAITALIGAVIALAKNWEVDLKIATDAERMNYHTYSRMAGAAIAVMSLLMAILLLRLRTWIGGLAVGVVALAFPLYHNYHFLQFEPLTPYMAHITKQADLLKLAKEAPQPARLVEENQLKNEGMLHNVASASGYHPIILSAYSDAMGTLGPASDAFGEIYAVNYGRTFSEEPPADGNWQSYVAGNTAGRGSSLWQRTNMAPYVRATAEVMKVDTDEMSLTSSSLRAIAMDAMAGGAGARTAKSTYVARVSEYDARRFRLYEGMQMADAQLQRWTPHEVRLHIEAAAPGERQNALLPLSEPFSPGWQAETSGGRRLPIISVNGLQRGVVLPPGEFNIRLRYIPYALRLGLFISMASATVLLAFGMGTIGRRIKRGQKKVQKALKQSQGDRPAPNPI